MEKKKRRPALVRKISITDTLLSLNVGEEIEIDTKDIKTANLRNTASRLEKRGKARFMVSEQGLVNKTRVTRMA